MSQESGPSERSTLKPLIPVVAQRRIAGITLLICGAVLGIVAARGPGFGEVELVFAGALVIPAIVFARGRRAVRDGIYDAEVPLTPCRKTTSDLTIWAASRCLPVLAVAGLSGTLFPATEGLATMAMGP